jgi:hypothetical protein
MEKRRPQKRIGSGGRCEARQKRNDSRTLAIAGAKRNGPGRALLVKGKPTENGQEHGHEKDGGKGCSVRTRTRRWPTESRHDGVNQPKLRVRSTKEENE